MIDHTILLVILTLLSGSTAYAMGALIRKPSKKSADPVDAEDKSSHQM